MSTRVTLGTKLDGILGAKTTKVLGTSFGIGTVEALLRHYPRRYAERGDLTDLSRLQADEHVTVMARVETVHNYNFRPKGGGRPGGRNVRTEVVVTDGTGKLTLTFFRQPWRGQMAPGTLGFFAGKVNVYRGKRQLLHPDCMIPEAGDAEALASFGAPVPIYPATAQVSSWTIRRCVDMVLAALTEVAEPLPASVRERQDLWDLKDSLRAIHQPRNTSDYLKARKRFTYEEAFVVQAVLARRRHATAVASAVPRPPLPDGLRAAFERQLPFELTAGQHDVFADVTADLARHHPMYRLLQGEVGSGKTIVALLAMLQVIDAGGQAALLAPTEVLAQQHHRSITALLGDLAYAGMLGAGDLSTRVRLLTGSMAAKARRESLLDAASGEAGIVVGTHALLEDRVQFAELGLVVVDEQHRFGVEQRAALSQKAAVQPHVLVMTATPIPRTVAMTVFGDLETSTLKELPLGRQPIQTTVVPARDKPAWLERGWERVREEVERGRQAYVVCARIGDEASEAAETRALVEVFDELREGPLQGLRVTMLHGRMSAEDKDAAMTSFAAHDTDVLVATTVIEVGVDVPNATVMVVMDADRFGMSQLHQLRGRVGRGSEAGLCLLVSAAEAGTPARERLDAVAATGDGFVLAGLDIELRREGDVLGVSQSGARSSLRLLSIVHDGDVIAEAREDAREIVSADPTLAGHPALSEAVLAIELSNQADYLDKS